MKINSFISGLTILCLLASCGVNTKKEQKSTQFEKGSFGYDLQFLKSKDSVIVLKNGDAQVIVSPKYQLLCKMLYSR